MTFDEMLVYWKLKVHTEEVKSPKYGNKLKIYFNTSTYGFVSFIKKDDTCHIRRVAIYYKLPSKRASTSLNFDSGSSEEVMLALLKEQLNDKG